MSKFWSDIVAELTPYTPGEQPRVDGLIKLNTNENPYGPSPKVLSAIRSAASDNLRKYPDPNASALKKTIAHYYGLDANQVFVGNSSDEVLGHVFRGLLKKAKPLLFPDITYSFYPVYCGLFDIDYRRIPLRDDFSISVDDYAGEAGGVIFANPNAPTGLMLPVREIETLLARLSESQSGAVLVVDEAYVDFADESAISLIAEHSNLLVTQTLSKSRSLAGLRVGLALGQAHLIEALERVKNSFHPYALDALALAGAEAAFADNDYFQACRTKIINTRERFSRELNEMGFSVLASQANFVFASHPDKNARDIFNTLRAEKVLVRYFDKPRIDNFIRISIGTEEEMSAVSQVLKSKN